MMLVKVCRTDTHIDELLLFLFGHLSQAVVSTRQVILQASEGVHHHPLHLSALSTCAGRRQAQTSNTAARPHPRRQHILLIKDSASYLRREHSIKKTQYYRGHYCDAFNNSLISCISNAELCTRYKISVRSFLNKILLFMQLFVLLMEKQYVNTLL